MRKKAKEVTVNTEDKSTLYTGGNYPVGHIKRVIDDYVMRADLCDKLIDNMTKSIKAYRKQESETKDKQQAYAYNILSAELKAQLMCVDAWWEPSMDEANWDAYNPKSECDMQLRHFPGDKLGGKGL